MAKFNDAYLTDAGADLIAKVIADGDKIEFLEMVFGEGVYTEEEKRKENLRKRTELKTKRQGVPFSSVSATKENAVKLKAIVSNEDITDGYRMTEIGIIAKKSGDKTSNGILYSIAIAEESDYIPSKDNPITYVQEYYTKVSNAEQVEIKVENGVYALAEDLTAHINNMDNPHQVTKSHVGLGNVDNTADSEKPVSKEQQRVIDTKADKAHHHDDRYYTESEVNGLLGTKADIGHTHAWGSLTGTPSTFPPAPHGHDYLPHSGGTVNGNLAVTGNLSSDRYYTATPDKTMVIESGGFVNIQTGQSAQVRTYGDTGWAAISAREFVQQSSKRYKENIEEMTEIYAKKLLELRPVSYDYKNKADGVGCYGLIAEEVDAVESYPVYYNNDHEPEGIDYSKFVPQIIRMLQIHEKEIEKLKENREIRA